MRFHLLAAAAVIAMPLAVLADNQTPTLSPVIVGGSLPFTTLIQNQTAFPNTTLPTLHSFAKASYQPAGAGNSQWLMIGGMTNGMHDFSDAGFDPAAHNKSIYVIDPVTKQMWSRPLNDATSGLTAAQIDTLTTTNAQFTQKGDHLCIAGGYGFSTAINQYTTYDKLTSFDIPGLMNWVKNGSGSVASNMKQIADPIFRVTGGEMLTTSNGKSHLVFGQDYPDNYNQRLNGIYTKQVRTFNIVDNAGGLSVSNVVSHAEQEDFRRRDLNVVPVIDNVNGQLVDKMQALSGVFTPSFGAWTVPVNIDADGNATQPDPLDPSTFKQGMNGYRSANIGLYSATNDLMHTLLLGGISYQYKDGLTGNILGDAELPFISDCTDLVTDSTGNMTQYLLPGAYPTITSGVNGKTLLLGAETEFFLKDGIATYSNGVINLDALSGPTLIGWLYGGIAADAPNRGNTYASNAVIPVIINPTALPEPSAAMAVFTTVALLLRRRRAE